MHSTRRCSVDGCDRPFSAKGMCNLHYQRTLKGRPLHLERARRDVCEVDGCATQPRSAYGALCEKHYARVRRNGSPDLKDPKDYKKPELRPRPKTIHTCTVETCSERARSIVNGGRVCLMHYKRWKRHGIFDTRAIQDARARESARLNARVKSLYLAGHSTIEVGRIVGLDPSQISRRLSAMGVATRTATDYRRADISYGAAHMRVRTDRGSATQHVCACGAQAAQWAYQHNDPNERSAPEGAYSSDPAFYVAMCVPCHKRADLERIAREP